MTCHRLLSAATTLIKAAWYNLLRQMVPCGDALRSITLITLQAASISEHAPAQTDLRTKRATMSQDHVFLGIYSTPPEVPRVAAVLSPPSKPRHTPSVPSARRGATRKWYMVTLWAHDSIYFREYVYENIIVKST
mmetsp:Transcript_9863/g.29786  ORF Transcript_9863/g.29786 Transcript_9863/m.29786 type:complete len:135 (+) Transcript_9863:334-738(+)